MRGQSLSIPDWGKAIEYIVRSAKTRSVWLLLDALDEVPDPSNLIKMLQPLENWDCHVILSSRPHAFEGTKFPFEVTEYHLAPFSPQQIEVFLQGWLKDRELRKNVRAVLKRPGSINRMATNPLLLTLLCGFAERHGVRDEITRSELYDGVLHDILGLAADKRSAIDYQRAEAWLPFLVDLMWNSMWTDGGKPMAIGELIRFIESSDKSPDARDVAAASPPGKKSRQQAMALLEELREKGILVPIDGRRSAYQPCFTVRSRSTWRRVLYRDTLEGRRSTLVIDPITGSTATASELWDVLDRKAWSPAMGERDSLHRRSTA